jgi:hypothetical protein
MEDVPVVIAWLLCLTIYLVAVTRIVPPMQDRPSDVSYAELAGIMVSP